MAFGRFVLEGGSEHINLLAEFISSLAESAADNPDGVIRLEEIGPLYGWHQSSDVLITDAQWCKVNRTAVSLHLEGNYPDMLSGIQDIVSFMNEAIAVYYSISDYGSKLAVTNDKDSRYFDARILMLLAVNPKLAAYDATLFQLLQEIVGGAYRFKDEAMMTHFVFDTFGFRPDSQDQISEIVELYSYQMVLDRGVKLSIDEALTNTDILLFIESD